MHNEGPLFMSGSMAARSGSAGAAAAPAVAGPAADILVCPDADHRPRWRPGERLHHLFEQRCDRYALEEPQHLAVDGSHGAWTYADIDARANRLARWLLSCSIGPGQVVALLLDKGADSYIAMLAVLKVHAAYVPLDPGFPADRIAFIASDAGAAAVLTTSDHRESVTGATSAVLCLDEAAAQIDALPDTRLDQAETGPPVSELCYIIYTSGSTGRPKGVPIEHASICNFVRVAAEVYGYRDSDRVYQGLTLAFDFAVEEIWVPLVVGATLLPNQTGSSLLGEELAGFLRRHRATALCCVPTLLATLDEPLPQLRLLIVSGEACPRDLITRWHSPDRILLNAYGPTETTVTATVSRPVPGEPVTIGPPLPTYSVVILAPDADEALPFGETGEIGIAGIGVARGYLNREEQTRKAFIPDFLDIPNNPSGLIYRSGDLGRVNGRGEVEYLGRIDTQVKIRGYRIELTEIESVILGLPQVAQAVVNTFEPLPGVKELAAYYTLRPGAELAPEELARALRELLPGYMVPAWYEPLAQLPMLASDKADRNALPPPSGQRMNAAERDFVEPQGERETAIAALLGRVLKLDKVSVEDDFFDDLGANSLLMAQFSAQLRSELAIGDLSMREIYLHPSVRRLAAALNERAEQQPAVMVRADAQHVAGTLPYVACGAAQLVLGFAWVWLQALLLWEGYGWIIEAPTLETAWARSVGFGSGVFVLFALLPVAAKWSLVGRWKAEAFPVWGLKYLRFWTLKQLMRINPMALFAGTPIYTAWLRLMGAQVGWRALLLSPRVPICTDLISIADGALVSRHVALSGYRAEAGRIHLGPVRLGRDTFVGDGSLIDIDTVMEDGSELAHASSLHRGQRLAAGRSYHGSPAQSTDDRFRTLEGGKASMTRMFGYSLARLAAMLLLFGPLPFLVAHHFLGADHQSGSTPIGELIGPASVAHLDTLLGWTSLFFLVSLLTGLATVILVPRLLNRFVQPGRVYPLFGIHYYIHRSIESLSNSKFYNELFGDSSYIVHYLAAIGYRFLGLEQTGSNFGMAQRHENPFLCEIGRGTMVSDGLSMLNVEHSTSSFRLSRIHIGARNFLGNAIIAPPGGKTGENCLLGTKVMVPIHGPVRENTGLLGSPSFEIPRSVRRDARFDHYKRPELLRERLRLKNASNIGTMLLFLMVHWVALNVMTVTWYYTYGAFIEHGPLYLTSLAVAGAFVLTPWYIFVDRASLGFRRLQPQYCSIYDDYFWWHERHWKLGMSVDNLLLAMLNGTPFKGLAWRALGVRVGRKLFDDGCAIPEKTLVSLGDHCTVNDHSTLQSHSLEDGSFKSDHIVIGNGCTVGAHCYVHYGVNMEDGVTLEPDAFLMKGEQPQAHSVWRGNPARVMTARA